LEELRENLLEAIELWLEAGETGIVPGGQDEILELAV